MQEKLFKTEQEATEWVSANTPIAIKPARKAKTTFVCPFSSYNAFDVITKHLGSELFKLLK